jgi:F-type H+-transporting ATPase subunit epsilon
MATIKVDLVSPERLLASVEADLAQIPGQMGEFTALPGHAPFLSTLRPGVVTIRAGGADKAYFVTGGFAEVSANAASVLAEEAVERDALTRSFLDAKLAEAEKALAEASDEAKPALALRVNDYRNAIAVLGL